MKKKIAIIDFKLGNLFSVLQACNKVGLNASITSDRDTVLEADAIILPGVGAFGEAMYNLKVSDLLEPIKKHADASKPLFGICLGMQLLFSESEEFGSQKGIGLIKGKILKFTDTNGSGQKLKVPQIGWNRITDYNDKWSDSPLNKIESGSYMYFVHSFYAYPRNRNVILSKTNYEGIEYCSSIFYNNCIFATQFHPEKSGKKGIEIYKEWAERFQLI